MKALVTGATGYVGGRLVPELLSAGIEVRAMARTPGKLDNRDWRPEVEVVAGDVNDSESLERALAGVDVAYYLVHSMADSTGYADLDREAATRFAEAAEGAGVGRIVYLGGIAPTGEKLSIHLQSRREVGEVFLASGVPTAVLQAGVILGSGSASFEMMRNLSERLPVMVAPKWIKNRIQPIAVRDVLSYLAKAAELPADVNRTFDIAGPDILTYRDMMKRYARLAGLTERRILALPALTPRLAGLWVGLVTPVPTGVARPLVGSLIHEVLAKENDFAEFAPEVEPIGFDEAVELALARIRDLDVRTTWYSASTPGASATVLPEDPDWAGGAMRIDERSRPVRASADAVWSVVEGIGGGRGWYSWRLGWASRGLIDRFFGGPGLKRGRRHPDQLTLGEAVDWWRVEKIRPGTYLLLRAEMRLPGSGWLEFRVEERDRYTVLHQRAVYRPRGLLGVLYWWAVWPFHGIVFEGMQRNMARAAVSHDA